MTGVVTRFPNGVTNVGPGSPLAAFGAPSPFKFHTYFNDFDVFTAGDWTVTVVDGGTDTAQVTAIGDADGGVLTVTTNDADNDNVCLEAQGESWKFEAGKKLWLAARFSVSDADDSDLYIGLHSTDTNPFSTAPAQRAYFLLAEGAATVTFDVDDNAAPAASGTVATLADATMIELAAYYDGVSTIELFANGVKTAEMTGVAIPDTELAIGFGVATGTTAARTMLVDYLMVAKER